MKPRWRLTTIAALLALSLALPVTAEPTAHPVDSWLDWLAETWANLVSTAEVCGSHEPFGGDEMGPYGDPAGNAMNTGDEMGPLPEPIGNSSQSSPGTCGEMFPMIDPDGCEEIGGAIIPNGEPHEVGGAWIPNG